jgi:hypothetical protein
MPLPGLPSLVAMLAAPARLLIIASAIASGSNVRVRK